MKKSLIILFIGLGIHSYTQTFKTQNLQITGGSPGLNKVLTADSYGNVSWQSFDSLGIPIISTSFIQSPSGKIWMDRNLGASQQAASYSDYSAYGSLYQWGRASDGHELIAWSNATTGTATNGSTITQSSTVSPGNNLFITPTAAPYNWCTTDSTTFNSLWQGVSGANNPCPTGFRVPSVSEFQIEASTYNSNKLYNAWTNLKIVAAGYRDDFNLPPRGRLFQQNFYGCYWTSSLNGYGQAWCIYFTASSYQVTTNYPSVGFSVRCIKN